MDDSKDKRVQKHRFVLKMGSFKDKRVQKHRFVLKMDDFKDKQYEFRGRD